MTLAALLAFNAALLLAILSPGPSLLFLTRQTLEKGRATGIATAAGLGTMAALWTLTALLGLDALFALFPWLYGTLKTLGALYLIWIAWNTWRSARQPVTDRTTQGAARRAFLQGMLVNLGNPKSVLFAGAVLVVIFPPDLALWAKVLIFLNHLAVELILQPLLAVMLSAHAIRARYLGAKLWLDRTAAAILGALGLRLLLED